MANPLKSFIQSEEEFKKNLKSVLSELEKEINAIVNGLPRSGKLFNLQKIDMAQITQDMYSALEKSGYNELIQETLLKSKDDIAKQLGFMAKALPDTKAVLGHLDDTTINSFLKMGYVGLETVPAELVEKVKNTVYQAAILGKSSGQLVSELEAKLSQFGGHAQAQVNTFRREFIQKSEEHIAEQVGFGDDVNDIWEYVGAPIQTNSHPECVWAVEKRYFTNEEKIDFQNGGGYPHTEPRWNCQHIFQISNVTYKEAFGKEPEEKIDFDNLNKEQRGVIKDYTSTEWGYKTNETLRDGKKLTGENKKKANLLTNIINAAPNHKGFVYRGFGLSNKEYAEFIKTVKGREYFIDRGFMSTTADPKIISRFYSTMTDNVVRIRIKSKSGAYIADYSKYKLDEKEVLFKPNSKFKIVGYKEKPLSSGKKSISIVLEEI